MKVSGGGEYVVAGSVHFQALAHTCCQGKVIKLLCSTRWQHCPCKHSVVVVSIVACRDDEAIIASV